MSACIKRDARLLYAFLILCYLYIDVNTFRWAKKRVLIRVDNAVVLKKVRNCRCLKVSDLGSLGNEWSLVPTSESAFGQRRV